MKYLRRFATYTAKAAVALSLIAGLAAYVFYMAFNLSNAYIIVSEGLKERVDYVLRLSGSEALEKYFTYDFILNDQTLKERRSGNDEFSYFDVNSYDYDLDIDSLRWHPLQKISYRLGSGESVTARGNITCTVTEKVKNISASRKREYSVGANGDTAQSATTPKWSGGRYEVTLVKIDGEWYIAKMVPDKEYRDPDF